MDLALSVSWNALARPRAQDLLFEIMGLGFKDIELSFNLTEKLLRDIRPRLQEMQMGVVSLHNYCPIPDGLKREEALPDCYSLSSLDEEERQRAIHYTKRTIDTASLLKARAVVLHCGKVEIPDGTRELIELYGRGAKDTPAFDGLKATMVAQRQGSIKPFLDQSVRSREELNEHAKTRGVFLGIETRFYYREIPLLDEIGFLLDRFKDSHIYYWHDTGHAEVMQRLGFFRHQDYLKLYGDRMIGIHLHDVLKCQDHMAPSQGDFDFSWLRPYLKKETIKVMEAHHPATAADIKKGREYLEKLFYGAC
ncbi:MAG: TIM barrel protein [Candidatus Omnitrophota bacterium]